MLISILDPITLFMLEPVDSDRYLTYLEHSDYYDIRLIM